MIKSSLSRCPISRAETANGVMNTKSRIMKLFGNSPRHAHDQVVDKVLPNWKSTDMGIHTIATDRKQRP